MTTSFGYQSELLFRLFSEIKLKVDVLFISSPLSFGGVSYHRDLMLEKYGHIISYHEVDRSDWLEEKLGGKEFLELKGSERQHICRQLKRTPLIDYIEYGNKNIWVSGIRRAQTPHRLGMNFIESTDFGVVKYSPLCDMSETNLSELKINLSLTLNSEYVDLCKINDSKECGLHV